LYRLKLSCSLDSEYKILQRVEETARSRHSHIVSRLEATFFQDGKYLRRPGRLSGTEKLENVSSLSSGITSFVVDHPISRSSRARSAHDFHVQLHSQWNVARNSRFDQWRYSGLISVGTSIWRGIHYFLFLFDDVIRERNLNEDPFTLYMYRYPISSSKKDLHVLRRC